RKFKLTAKDAARASSTKQPNAGQAHIDRNTQPATELIVPTKVMSRMKPVRFSDRCGVSNAENSVGSASKELPVLIRLNYTVSWPKRRFRRLAKRRPDLQ